MAECFFIAVSLAMDAFAVAVSSGIAVPGFGWRQAVKLLLVLIQRGRTAEFCGPPPLGPGKSEELEGAYPLGLEGA